MMSFPSWGEGGLRLSGWEPSPTWAQRSFAERISENTAFVYTYSILVQNIKRSARSGCYQHSRYYFCCRSWSLRSCSEIPGNWWFGRGLVFPPRFLMLQTPFQKTRHLFVIHEMAASKVPPRISQNINNIIQSMVSEGGRVSNVYLPFLCASCYHRYPKSTDCLLPYRLPIGSGGLSPSFMCSSTSWQRNGMVWHVNERIENTEHRSAKNGVRASWYINFELSTGHRHDTNEVCT